MTPQRIQLRRTKGWRKPEGCITVARPSRWGNPYRLARPREQRPGPAPITVVHADKWGRMTGPAWGGFSDETEATAFAVDLYRRALLAAMAREEGWFDYYLGPLVGHDLGCWCVIGAPCHGDVLLTLAASRGADDCRR
jgi:hypothetical protein